MAKAAGKAGKKKSFKKKDKRVVPFGVVHIRATFNNTMVCISDPDGKTICWSSAGALGFRGSRKGTPFAAQQAAARAATSVRAALACVRISSQLVDNLNASIHLRAVLTGLFLADEIVQIARG